MEMTLCPKCQQPMKTGTDYTTPVLVCLSCAYIIRDDGGVLFFQQKRENTGLVELFEAKFAEHCPDMVIAGKEVKVAPGRRMRWDYVIEDASCPRDKVAVEVDGMAHRTRERFWSDTEKHNVAMLEGWKWLRCNRALLSDDRKCKAFFDQLRRLVNPTMNGDNPNGN